jgi:hypothetical protein
MRQVWWSIQIGYHLQLIIHLSINCNKMKYLFYKVWQIFSKIKTNDMPATNAMILISVCEFANIGLLYIILLQLKLLNVIIHTRIEGLYYAIPISLIVYTFNYLYLYKNRKELYNRFKDESKRQKVFGYIFLFIYITISFASIFYFGSKYSESIVIIN